MNNSAFNGSEIALSKPLAGLELPITVSPSKDFRETFDRESEPVTFGQVAKFLSVPFRDEGMTAEEFSKLTPEDKRKRDGVAGHWLPGRARSSKDLISNYSQSFFVFDVLDWRREEFEELIRICLIPDAFAVIMHSLRGHTPDNPRVRIIYPLFTPISLAEAYLAQPKVPELLCHLGLSGRVVGERLSEVDRSLELPNVSWDEDYWFRTIEGTPIFADTILEMLSDGVGPH